MYHSSTPQPRHDLHYSSESTNSFDPRPKLAQQAPTYLEAPVRHGLQTPPEDMGTTYQNPPYNSYGSRPDVPFQNSGRTSSHHDYAMSHQHSRATSTLSQPSMNAVPVYTTKVEATAPYASYSRPESPQRSEKTDAHVPQVTGSSSANDQIMSNLQIPKTINSSGGSLAEFAAQITCLFWFETADTLKEAENVTPTTLVPRLKTDALPTTGFRKWVVTTLTTTQVSRNVILLALLFIYRLKSINPGVKGRCGSEYRLLTVALMLGNKFLDDNTYTNKTWAEVSGISVTEIHVMEVEFLSNMRYTLLASEQQWAEWQQKLSKFWTYLDNAGKPPAVHYSPQGISVLQPNLPSPPITLQSSPSSAAQLGNSLNVNYPLPDPLHSLMRKRSFESDLEEPSAKRVSRPHTTAPAPYPAVAQASRREMQPTRHDAVHLPIPNLTVSTGLPMTTGSISNSFNTTSGMMQNAPVLPPLSGRAMSTVYPSSTQSWTPNPPLLTPTSVLPPPQVSGYSTPTRRHSPHTAQALMSLGSSPISAQFPQNTGHISPSFFLQQRSSPYRPVRHVETLLYPPPSASMHDYSANADHMQYQPLGRRNDYRAGVVPHYPQPGYLNGPTPRQPNFAPKPQVAYVQQQ